MFSGIIRDLYHVGLVQHDLIGLYNLSGFLEDICEMCYSSLAISEVLKNSAAGGYCSQCSSVQA